MFVCVGFVCEDGYSTYKGQCLKMGDVSLSWNSAASYCASQGDRLVEILDADKQTFVAGKCKM